MARRDIHNLLDSTTTAVVQIRKVESKVTFRSALVSRHSLERAVFGISATILIASRSMRFPAAITILITRINKKADTG